MNVNQIKNSANAVNNSSLLTESVQAFLIISVYIFIFLKAAYDIVEPLYVRFAQPFINNKLSDLYLALVLKYFDQYVWITDSISKIGLTVRTLRASLVFAINKAFSK